MLTQRTMGFGIRRATAVAALLMGATNVSAEPPACYAGRPSVLAAPMTYGTAYRTSNTRMTYAGPSTETIYRRTYSEAAREYDSARIVYAKRRRSVNIPVVVDASYDAGVYDTTYYAPPRVTYLPVRYSYGHHGRSSYYVGHHSRPTHHRAAVRFFGHGGFGRYAGHHRRSWGHRRVGVGLSFGRSHHGGHGGFSFSYGR